MYELFFHSVKPSIRLIIYFIYEFRTLKFFFFFRKFLLTKRLYNTIVKGHVRKLLV